MITDGLIAALESCREDIERRGTFQDVTLTVRADAIDVKITKRIRCVIGVCKDDEVNFSGDVA